MFKKSFFLLVFAALVAVLYPLHAARFPGPQGWTGDFAGVIGPEYRERIERLGRELERKTSAELAVVTVESLDGESVETYAVSLFEEWGIGKKGKDNGVLLLAAIRDRKVRIEVGYGLEGVLTDGTTGAILDRYVLPPFKAGNYGEGLSQGALAIASVIAKDAGVELEGGTLDVEQRGGVSVVQLLVFLVLFIIFIRNPLLFLLLFGGGRGGRGGGGFGGGFGGFGGGRSGGGGASRGW